MPRVEVLDRPTATTIALRRRLLCMMVSETSQLSPFGVGATSNKTLQEIVATPSSRQKRGF